MSDPLNELFNEKPAEQADVMQDEAPAIEAQESEAITPPEPEASKGEQAAPPAAPEERHQSIPISALMDEREKRQAAERQAQDYQRRIQEFEAQQQKRPDFFDDPEKAFAAERQMFAQAMWNQQLNTSELMAKQSHGAQVVDTAANAFMEAARSNPALAMELHRQQHPYDFVVNWHKQQTMLSEIGNDPAAYREKLRAELMAEMQSQAPQPAPQARATTKPTIPPRSMAAAPAAGGSAAASGSSFDAIFQ